MYFLRFLLFCMCIVPFARGRLVQSTIPETPLKSNEISSDLEQWFPHLLEFMELLDIKKFITIALEYMYDPEVINFAVFITSPQFSELVYEFESMDEFKEAFQFLASKGYDVEMLLNMINSALNLPPFEKPFLFRSKTNGIHGLLQDIMAALPIDEMKKLFENKLETSKELAELFETINSEEFVHILRKMSKNPKFRELKKTLESYGFDFEMICAGAKEIFGDYYQGIFCE